MSITVNKDFKLADVTVDVTVMEGLTTSNHMVRGTVRQIIPGVCFMVDNGPGSQISYLWRSLATVDGAEPSTNEEIVVDAPPAMRRTDSGADYGFNGFPDCAWWLAQGVQPLFVATPFHYGRTELPVSPLTMAGILEDCKERATEEGGVFLDAWKRQLSDITLMDLASSVVTPPSSPSLNRSSSSAVCPDAPRKLRLDVPSLEEHRGLGILPGDFIKPDPVMTRVETRRYLLDEFERYMTGDIQSRARACFGAHLTMEEIAEEVDGGLWPAGRLYRLRQALEDAGKLPDEPVELQFDHVARWIVSVVRGYVETTVPLNDPLEFEAMGFLTVDLLPGGKTIDSFWDHSPFDALRSAPPLSEAKDDEPPLITSFSIVAPEADAEEQSEESEDSDDSDYVPEEEEEDETEDETEEETEEETEDETEDETEEEEYTPMYKLLHQELSLHVKIPTWVPLAGLTAVLSYLWVVGFVTGRCGN
jgi:hypothetical protein